MFRFVSLQVEGGQLAADLEKASARVAALEHEVRRLEGDLASRGFEVEAERAAARLANERLEASEDEAQRTAR